MGAYVNPPDPTITKEEWLQEHGILTDTVPDSVTELPGCFPVCLVDNGPFTAAAIAFSDEELSIFRDPSDPRPKKWFWVEEEKLYTASREFATYLNRYREMKR